MIAETFIILTVMFIAVMGPSVVIAVLGYAVIKALSRNPSAASKIFMGMAVMLVFVEAIAIVSILIIFQLFQNKQGV
jgi:F0F1-type ATP synthase membrane subunit c/vacuolar-type H+-ATPase subunit K